MDDLGHIWHGRAVFLRNSRKYHQPAADHVDEVPCLLSIHCMQVNFFKWMIMGDAGDDRESTMGWCGVVILMTCLSEHEERDDT